MEVIARRLRVRGCNDQTVERDGWSNLSRWADCFLGGFLCFFLVVSQDLIAQEVVPGEVIVKLKSHLNSSQGFAFLGKAHSQKEMTLKSSFGKMGIYHFALKPGQSIQSAINELEQDPDVEYAEPNYILRKAQHDLGPFETYSKEDVQAWSASSNKETMGIDPSIESAWQNVSSSSSNKPIIAVIDTGLDVDHEVFIETNALWRNPGEIAANNIDDDGNGFIDDVYGWNFVDNSGHMYDDDRHGTHVAGLILSVDQNIYENSLRESKIQIMPLKFLDGNGVGSTANAVRAIHYAVQNGATILNNSWGGPSYSAALHDAVAFSYEQGVSFIAAAGNSGSNNDEAPMYPASYKVPNVVSVAATHNTWSLTAFSNFGKDSVHLGARGFAILSTIPGGSFGTASGTSMSAPFVAGTAAQMKVQSPQMLGYQIKNILFDSSNYEAPLSEKLFTEGRLNAASAISAAAGAIVQVSQPTYNGSLSGNSRELASSIAQGGGGCGLVKHWMGDQMQPPGGTGGAPSSWYVLLLLGVLLAPVALVLWMKARLPENRRRHERFQIDTSVKLKVGEEEMIGTVSCISAGGACINTAAWLDQGGLVQMTITSPDGKDQVEVAGRVVWSAEKQSYGVAFEPQSLTQMASSKIKSWTKSLMAAS